jgi:hypothetical protein
VGNFDNGGVQRLGAVVASLIAALVSILFAALPSFEIPYSSLRLSFAFLDTLIWQQITVKSARFFFECRGPRRTSTEEKAKAG